jgi:hypothetical protein
MSKMKRSQRILSPVPVSKNQPTIEQLRIACRHVNELREAGVSENLAIRTLELFADVYAKLLTGGSATPHHVSQVRLWSAAALRIKNANPSAKPREHFRVEHGTPRRDFARKVMELHRKTALTEQTMDVLVNQFWKLAVITIDEDAELNRVARSQAFATPEERWAAAKIEFEENTHTKAPT